MNSLGRLNLKSQQFYIILLFLLAIAENIIAATWNVDPYHEGALFPTAVGLADGLAPFRGVSQQYGFLGPLLVSLLLRVFGNYLIVERLFGATLIISIAIVLYFNLRALATRTVAIWITLLWFSISPIWGWPVGYKALSGGYWPNHLGIFMVLLGILLIQKSKASAFLGGGLVLLASQARVEFIFVWLFMTIAIFLKEKEKRFYWAAGSFFAVISVCEYLVRNRAIKEWFDQTILVWTMNPPDVPQININFFIFNAINFLGVVAVGCLVLTCSMFFEKRINNFALFLTADVVLIWSLLNIPNLINFQIKFGNYDFAATVKYVFANTLFSYINVSITICFLATIYLLMRKKDAVVKHLFAKNSSLLLLFSASLGLLSLFHNFNPDYSQMVWPVFSLFLVAIVTTFQISPLISKYNAALPLLAVGLIFVTSISFFSHLVAQSHTYKTPMLKGLYGNSKEQVRNLDNSFNIIQRGTEKGRMRMVCQTGLFSINGSGFLGSDKWTWNQQPAEMISYRLEHLGTGETVLACHLNSSDSTRIQFLLSKRNITVVDKSPSFTLYRVVKAF